MIQIPLTNGNEMKPKIFGSWQVEERIDDGGQGIVYKASSIDVEAEPVRAIKIIKRKDGQSKARFEQEVLKHKELSDVKAPNIMPVIDYNLVDSEDGGFSGYIVMPLAETTLQESIGFLIERTELCIEVFRGIVNGIAEAQNIGVIHRDIKPRNILFLDRLLKEPLVSDFGICFVKYTEEEDRLTEVGETVGAKFFMAPEQERGGVVDISESADVYALGKLLYYMLSGKHMEREDLHSAFSKEEFTADPRLKIIKSRILDKTIVREPDRRVQTATDLLAIVDGVIKSFGKPPPYVQLAFSTRGC